MNYNLVKLSLGWVWMAVLLISACNPASPTLPPLPPAPTASARAAVEAVTPAPSPLPLPTQRPTSPSSTAQNSTLVTGETPTLSPRRFPTLRLTPVISQPLQAQNSTPVYVHVTARQLDNIPVSYLERGEQQIIRYTECKDCFDATTKDLPELPWYELTLPDGKPQSIPYPHAEMIAPTIRQKLGLDSRKIGYNDFRISPSGKNIIFIKYPAENTPLALFQADGQGNKVQMIESFPSSVLEVVWSKDERAVLTGGFFWESGDIQGYDVHYVDLDRNTVFDLNRSFQTIPSPIMDWQKAEKLGE